MPAQGFTTEDCRTLPAPWNDSDRASADVRAVTRDHLKRIEAKIADLVEMRDTLADLVTACSGDDRPACPILKSLEDPGRS